MLTRPKFEAYLIKINAPTTRLPSDELELVLSKCRYYHGRTSWSEFASTIANCILKDASYHQIESFISEYAFDLDDPYDYYRAAVRSGLPLRQMSYIIHTKANLC